MLPAGVLIDDQDRALVAERRWYIIQPRNVKYVRSIERKGYIYLHRLLCPGEGLVDHINGNGLDNRRCNLRLVTNQENQRAHRKLNAASGFRGVFQGARGRPFAAITVDGRMRRIGSFDTLEEAARAYDAEARRLFGEHACPNFSV